MKLQSGLGIIQVRFYVFYFNITHHLHEVNEVIVPASPILAVCIFESSIFKDLVWIHHEAMISAISAKIMRAARFVLHAGCRVEDR